MLPTREIHSSLRRVSVFDGLTDPEIDAFSGFFRERRIDANCVLFREGDRGDSLFVVLQGSFTVDLLGPNGESLCIGHLGPGDVIGELACLDNTPRSATLIATSKALALELTWTEFERMSRDLPRVASLLLGVILQELTDRLRAIDRRIESELGRGSTPLPAPLYVAPPVQISMWQRLAARFRGDE